MAQPLIHRDGPEVAAIRAEARREALDEAMRACARLPVSPSPVPRLAYEQALESCETAIRTLMEGE